MLAYGHRRASWAINDSPILGVLHLVRSYHFLNSLLFFMQLLN